MRTIIRNRLAKVLTNQGDVTICCLGWRRWNLLAKDSDSYSRATLTLKTLRKDWPAYEFNLRIVEVGAQ